jgi:hypothetical protein
MDVRFCRHVPRLDWHYTIAFTRCPKQQEGIYQSVCGFERIVALYADRAP